MNSFEKRERAFETKFARDREMEFKIHMRACGIFGIKIATEKLHLSQQDAVNYGEMIVAERLRHVDLDKVFAFVKNGLNEAEVTIDDREIQLAFSDAHTIASEELLHQYA